MPEIIDPEELPFTADEIYEAAKSFLRPKTARLMADHLATVGPLLAESRVERRAEWERAGLPNAATKLLYGWEYPAELLPALAGLSPELAQRVGVLEERLRRGTV
jgi:hypothetical protein